MTKKLIKSPVIVSQAFLNEQASKSPKFLTKGDFVSTKMEKYLDAFLMTDKYNFELLGYFGERIASFCLNDLYGYSDTKNLNELKSKNFYFGDLIVGDVGLKGDVEILSVKATSTKDFPFNNSKVSLNALKEMFSRKGRGGFSNELQVRDPAKPIKLGVIGIRVLKDKFEIKKYSREFTLNTYKDDYNVIKVASITPVATPNDPIPLKKYLGSEAQVQKVFGDPEAAFIEFKTSNQLSLFIQNSTQIETKRKFRTDLLQKFRENLAFVSNEDLEKVINMMKGFSNKTHNINESTLRSINEFKLEAIKERRKRSKCRPARRRINSGGKAGSHADPRTGGKQAYAALKAAKPPGSRGGWTKKKCICCHKCPNDRSAPNGFVCTNPSHLYWGTKADNTYDQNRGNGWAARNKKQNEGDPNGEKAFAHELMISEDKVRNLIRKILKEDAESESWFGKSFVDFKKATNSGKDPLKYAKDNLIEVGRGSTRVVFDLPDNPGYVLKIINTEVEKTDQTFIDARGNIMPDMGPEGDRRTKHGFFKSHMRQSNQWEADLVMQQKYPNVFPKTFEYADDFSWILAEKAKTMPIGQNDIDNLFNLLGIKRSNFDKQKSRAQKKRELLNLIDDAMRYFKNPDHRLRQLNEAPPTFAVTDFMQPGDTFVEDENSTKYIDNNSSNMSISKEDQQLKDLISDSHNRQVISAMLDLNIPAREFLPKNLGISEITGKLLIIDASLWETHKPIRE